MRTGVTPSRWLARIVLASMLLCVGCDECRQFEACCDESLEDECSRAFTCKVFIDDPDVFYNWRYDRIHGFQQMYPCTATSIDVDIRECRKPNDTEITKGFIVVERCNRLKVVTKRDSCS